MFEEYGVNTALFYPVNPGSGKIPALVLTLMVDPGWHLVHADELAVIFLRAGTRRDLPVLDKRSLERALTARAAGVA